MAFVVLTAFSCVLATIFQCTPIYKAWEYPSVGRSCIQVNAMFYAHAGLDIFQDLIIYILPMKMLYRIQLPKRQKYALMFIFAVGGFVVVTGMIRLYYLQGAQSSKDLPCEFFSYIFSLVFHSNDSLDDNVGGAIWSAIECNIGVVCASLPHFKTLFDRYFPSLMGRSHGASGQNGFSGGEHRANAGIYIKKTHTIEFELEDGQRTRSWKDTCEGKYRTRAAVVNVENGTNFTRSDSKERLRDSTSAEMAVSRDGDVMWTSSVGEM